jgi:hypothetical protein
MNSTVMKNSNTSDNDNEWSLVNKKTKNKKNIQPIINKKNRVCMYYARGNCNNKINCSNGLHLSEEERNKCPDIDVCFTYINSPYIHSIEDCIKINNGLCVNCAFGNCLLKNYCYRSHNPNIRYENDKKRLENIYIIPICENWINNIWCDGLCYKKHPKQCEYERILSENYKTCSSDCKNGYHQGSKICTVIKNNILPLCEPIEEVEIYKIGNKPIPRPFVKKVKEIKTEEHYYMIDHGYEYECIDILKSNNISNNIIIKNKNKTINKKINKSKEVLYFDNIDNEIENNNFNNKIENNNFNNKIENNNFNNKIENNNFNNKIENNNFNNKIENTISINIYENKNTINEIENNSDNKIENTININSYSYKRKLTILQRKKQKIINKNEKRKEKRSIKKHYDSDSDSDDIKIHTTKNNSDSETDSDYVFDSDSDSEH